MSGLDASKPDMYLGQQAVMKCTLMSSVFQFVVPCTGVESVDISLPEQKVVVKGNVTSDAVLAQVAKSGKKTELWK